VSELAAYVQLGFHHITDLRGADHILFLLALAAIYRFRDWRECLWVATAFTVGHSLTLGLAVTNVLTISPALIEFLIPITIVATGIENLLVRDNVNGRLYPAGNARALAAILKELAANPKRVEEWRSNLTSVRTMDDVTADYLAMYAA